MKPFTLDPEVNNSPKYQRDNKAVNTALELIRDSWTFKKVRDTKNFEIQKLFEDGFEVAAPTGPRKIPSLMLFQAMWRLCNKFKMLDFSVHGSGRPEHIESVVTQAISTALRRGEYVTSLTGKQGGFFTMGMYGNSFMMIGANPDKKSSIPIKFTPISNGNLYVDPYATGIRIGGMGRSAQRACVVFTMSWAQAIQLFPKLKRVGTAGRIPRESEYNWKQLERDHYQTQNVLKEETDIAYFYDLPSKTYIIFGGPTCAVLEEHSGDNYPFVMDGEPYIPITQLTCIPSSEGFYDKGVGDILYKLAVVSRQLLNMQYGYVAENTWPMTLYNIPNGESSKFLQKLKSAYRLREEGYQAAVAMEYDPKAPGAGQVSAQSLVTGNLTQQWQIMYQRLDQEVRRCGIFLDDIDNDPKTLATQIISREENSNAFVKQIMDWNAPEIEFLINLTMDMMKKFIRKTDKTPLDLTTKIQVEGQDIRMDQFTFGAVSDELRKNHYFTRINSRSGAIPSNVSALARLQNQLNVTLPGTKAYFKIMESFSRLNDLDYSIDDFMPPQPQAPVPAEGGGNPEDVNVNQPTETDKMVINSRAYNNPTAAF